MLRLLLVCAAAASWVSAADADESAPTAPEGVYICLQNAAMSGSVWHPAECKRLATTEEQIADRAGRPVIQVDHIEPRNAVGSINIWWKVDFRGVGKVTDKTIHWFCSDHGSGFTCVWQSTNNPEDWAELNQLRNYGMTDIPSAFWVSKDLVAFYRDNKPLIARRAANEARYAKAEALAKSQAFKWSYIPDEGGPCRPLGPTTPFMFMKSVSAKRHHSIVIWDLPIGDEDAGRSTIATSNDTAVPLKDGPIQEYRFFTRVDVCNVMLADAMPRGGIMVADADLVHKPTTKWLITDQTTTQVACHWPNAVTGKSPMEFLAILKNQGANITEVSKSEISTTDNRTSFEISFSYTLKGRAMQIGWSDLGDFGCDPKVKDRLQLP